MYVTVDKYSSLPWISTLLCKTVYNELIKVEILLEHGVVCMVWANCSDSMCGDMVEWGGLNVIF